MVWAQPKCTHAQLTNAHTPLLSVSSSVPLLYAITLPPPSSPACFSGHARRRRLPPQLRLALLHRFPLGASSLRLRLRARGNPSPRLAWSPPATTGSGALAAPLRWPRCLDVLPRPPPELSLDLAVLGHPPVSPMVWCCCCLLGWWWPLSVDASVALVCWWRWCRRCTSFPTLLPGTMAVLDCNPDGTCYCYVVLFGVMVWLMVRWCGCCYYFDLNQDTGGTASGCNPASSDSWSRDIPVVLLLQWFTNGDDATTAASTTLQG
jgi:hypothetical protein